MFGIYFKCTLISSASKITLIDLLSLSNCSVSTNEHSLSSTLMPRFSCLLCWLYCLLTSWAAHFSVLLILVLHGLHLLILFTDMLFLNISPLNDSWVFMTALFYIWFTVQCIILTWHSSRLSSDFIMSLSVSSRMPTLILMFQQRIGNS